MEFQLNKCRGFPASTTIFIVFHQLYKNHSNIYCIWSSYTLFLHEDLKVIQQRMLKVVLNYRPDVRRRLARPLKRLLDEAETRLSIHNSWLMIIMKLATRITWHFPICIGNPKVGFILKRRKVLVVSAEFVLLFVLSGIFVQVISSDICYW
jgi:hypothetical protein